MNITNTTIRVLIRYLIAEGKTPAEIKKEFKQALRARQITRNAYDRALLAVHGEVRR